MESVQAAPWGATAVRVCRHVARRAWTEHGPRARHVPTSGAPSPPRGGCLAAGVPLQLFWALRPLSEVLGMP